MKKKFKTKNDDKKTKRKIPLRKWWEVSNNLKIINTCTENCDHEFRSLAWFIDSFFSSFSSSSSSSFLIESQSQTYKHRSVVVVVGSSSKRLLRTVLSIQHAFNMFLFSASLLYNSKWLRSDIVVFRWWMAGGVVRPFNSNKMCTLRLHTQNEKKPHCFVYYVHIIIINNNKRRRQTSERNEQLRRRIEQKVRWLQGISLKKMKRLSDFCSIHELDFDCLPEQQ